MIFLEHVRAGDVRRHQVGRELDPPELQAERLRHLRDQHRFGQAGHAFEYAMPAAEHADHQLLDDVLHPDNHAVKLLGQLHVAGVKLLDGLNLLCRRLRFADRGQDRLLSTAGEYPSIAAQGH